MGLLITDIFGADTAFNLRTLTDRVIRTGYLVQPMAQLGLFNAKPITTTTFSPESLTFGVNILATQERSAPPTKYSSPKRVLYDVKVNNWSLEDFILADSVQNVRAGAGADISQNSVALQMVQALVDDKLQQMKVQLEATFEYHRINALQGYCLNADGSTIVDLFTLFGLTRPSAADWTLGTSSIDIGGFCRTATRAIQAALGQGMSMTQKYVAFCGTTFWDKLMNNASFKSAYQNRLLLPYSNDPLVQNLSEQGVFFNGVWFFQPYTNTIGGKTFIGASDAYIFPAGIEGMFYDVMAPAPYGETVNTLGLPMYAKLLPDPSGRNAFIKPELFSARFFMNTRPDAVIKVTTSN